MSQPKKDDDVLFDVRLVKHNMRRGKLNAAALREHLDALPDEAEHGVATSTRFSPVFEQRYHSDKH